MGRGARSVGGRDGPAPPQCGRAECFDPLLRGCVACRLFRTPEPRPASPPARPALAAAPCAPSASPAPAAGPSSPAPRTALQPREAGGAGRAGGAGGAGGAGARPEGALPLPGLLFGAPALLGLALALLLVGLVSWRRRRRRRGAASPEAADRASEEPLDNVSALSSGPAAATAPVWPLPKDPAATPPGHSVPVPATELGSTELVTTKTAGPEQP